MRVKVENRLDVQLRLYSRYFEFERQNILESYPWNKYYMAVVAIVFLAIFFPHSFLKTIAGLSIVGVLLYRWKVNSKLNMACREGLNDIREGMGNSESHYYLNFDDTGVGRESESVDAFYKWDAFGVYHQNETDTYLHWTDGELFDIISEDHLGAQHYHDFKELLVKHLG
jgi:hypothetical protein